ncbi:4Fe-4S binding protein [Desulfonatronum lacustre]|uniref:nucleotide-binding protein n=1 Tax=Desulfonatronum lacustre TaxID=66849 RepID=UPI00048B56C7|nr:ATP-binding protein [Desulfonatronum lacustre]
MIFAVASGKGGTGKTTVTASLAAIWEGPLTLVDLDVEEPNLHLFLNPEITRESAAMLEVPVHNPDTCTLCGECATFCQYKALAIMGKTMLFYPEMCHGCGGCLRICPEGALSPGGRELGRIVDGQTEFGRFVMGRLRVGEAMSPPLMQQVKQLVKEQASHAGMPEVAEGGVEGDVLGDVLIDAPPGVSCPAMHAVMDADAILLVTEPTPFGLYDFRLAVEAFSGLNKPMGAVINRVGIGDQGVDDYCRAAGIPIWAHIPNSILAAKAYSRGEIVARELPELRGLFQELKERMRAAVSASQEVGRA